VTNEDQVAAAARLCGDVTLVINNAGIAGTDSLAGAGGIEAARHYFETNFFGMLRVSQAFAPILGENGGGALLNVLSVVSWVNSPVLSAYSASKTAAWGLTNALRNELRSQNTQVLGLHVGFVDTDLTRGFDVPKSQPDVVVACAYDALESGASEALADEVSRQVKLGLSAEPGVYIKRLGE
jgi:NAD(P)-dependent dehydrogenase (short-subunit alcohol dehydrogenase family)